MSSQKKDTTKVEIVDKSQNVEKEETKEIASPATADCSVSVVSTTSVASEVSKATKTKDNQQVAVTDDKKSIGKMSKPTADVTLSKVNGVNGVVSSGRVEEQDQDNNDGWETVEAKGSRGKRGNNNGTKGGNEKSGQANNSQKSSSGSNRKNKNKSKGRNRLKQKDKDVVKPTLDSVENNIAKRGANTTKALMEERNKRQSIEDKRKADVNAAGSSKQSSRPATIRDAVIGNLSNPQPVRTKPENIIAKKDASKTASVPRKVVADQNTASTFQETFSSASRSFATESIRRNSPMLPTKSSNDVSDMRENDSNSSDETSTKRTTTGRKNSAPPLQTLVGPGNLNSSNSSVASSLEAPHATRHSSHHQKCPKEDDVGYHLLKVCERLSDDMNKFMTSRSVALSTRRRERGALLAALQETVQGIWAGRCHVEMYGSCATQLDLPSSDLDVVVCGLDCVESPNQIGRKQSFREDSTDDSCIAPDSPTHCEMNQAFAQQFYPPLTYNGNRVIRLATELERIPWAVQVKAIPTASVPVIKILADPSRLPGATSMDWMIHHQQQMAAAAVAAAEMNSAKVHLPKSCTEQNGGGDSQTKIYSGDVQNSTTSHHMTTNAILSPNSPVSYHATSHPWRGADVMNGLFSLDVTFEGPEHGGIGSTQFSASIVQEACNETGLSAESTPVVQVLMIIKELLAQRRLNEPFSGGLSSYAILLLVVAVVKERRIIKKEMERVERQCQAVSAPSIDKSQDPKKVVWPIEKQSKKPAPSAEAAGKKADLPKRSSWASIAKNPAASSQDSTQGSLNDGSKSRKSTAASIPQSSPMDSVSCTKTQDNNEEERLEDFTLFPQGSNDVLEVLCSGEPTAGKLLMHFLLFYGSHFDATTTCIDVGGTHHPDFEVKKQSKMHSHLQLSPFVTRKAGGSYNPITDVYTVDPLIVYDPLEGAESNNVTRSCYAWGNIRWTFEQCYNTLSGVVELGAGSNPGRGRSKTWPMQEGYGVQTEGSDVSRQVDELSPLLELLLSF